MGRSGFWNRVNRVVYTFTGPAQVGIGLGKIEAPYVPPADPACPICNELMADHVVRRGDANTPTHLICPRR
ncbi:hypothetical protein LQ757_12885 [Agromyces sp. SYSU K20354]|uniref:hypothetical protein n=1 Tax=Agromyces cavernae TaxID=2898659 RepID=UPI001E2B49B5|nr:hypothetical protein [Agromyces cavernae]MCD2443171.1 hypothetical protein [Agromyces cavernae]